MAYTVALFRDVLVSTKSIAAASTALELTSNGPDGVIGIASVPAGPLVGIMSAKETNESGWPCSLVGPANASFARNRFEMISKNSVMEAEMFALFGLHKFGCLK